MLIIHTERNPSHWCKSNHFVIYSTSLDFATPAVFLQIFLRLAFFNWMQPPHEAYWLFQCTNYPAWPWMSLWTTVSLWSACLTSFYYCYDIKNLFSPEWPSVCFALTPDLQWVTSSQMTSLTVRSQNKLWMCVWVCMRAAFTYAPMHVRLFWMHVHTCVCVHVHVGKITGWYILLCHHLCLGRIQTHSLPAASALLYLQYNIKICPAVNYNCSW